MRIRKAEIEDALGIATVQVLSSRDAYKNLMPKSHLESTTIEKREKIWTKILQDKDGEIVVAEDNSIKGYIHYGESRDQDKNKAIVMEIMSIYIHPENQCCGYGKLLVEYVLENLDLKFKELNLWVLDDNLNAKKFYEKMGFIMEAQKEIQVSENKMIEVRYRKDLHTNKA